MERFEAERGQSLDEVLRWYELQLALLNEEDRRLPQIVFTGAAPVRYRDRTLDEIREEFVLARKHLDYAAMLHLLTTAEALLRITFSDLASLRSRRPLARRFRQIRRERGDQIRLVADILDPWVDTYPETKRCVREFQGVVPLRDWLAHGRYWNPKMGRPRYSVRDVYDIAFGMFEAMERAR